MSEEIKIIEDFLNYNKNKEISGVEINAISKLLNCYYNQQKEIEKLKKDKDILYGVIDELKGENNE